MKTPEVIEHQLSRFMSHVYPLNPNTIKKLASCAQVRLLSRNDILCEEDKLFDSFVFVSEGIFQLSKVMNGENRTIAFGMEGDPYLSLSTYLNNKPSLFSYGPLTDSRVIMIDNGNFKQLVESTDLIMWFNKVLIRQIHALENRYVWLGQQDASSRYQQLIRLRPEIAKQIPLKYIASYLGVTQSSLSRIRAKIAGK